MLDLLFAVTQPRVLAGALLQAPLAFRLLRFMLPLRSPSWLLSGDRGPSGLPRVNSRIAPNPAGCKGMTERSWAIQKIRRFWRRCFKRRSPQQTKQTKQQQHDVCYRDWYLRVPTCTAAQLGLYVFARHSGRRVWCVQSRVGHLSSRHLQAQRSWSELQLSQQLLPSEEWGRIQGMLRSHNALIELINTLHGNL